MRGVWGLFYRNIDAELMTLFANEPSESDLLHYFVSLHKGKEIPQWKMDSILRDVKELMEKDSCDYIICGLSIIQNKGN